MTNILVNDIVVVEPLILRQ